MKMILAPICFAL